MLAELGGDEVNRDSNRFQQRKTVKTYKHNVKRGGLKEFPHS